MRRVVSIAAVVIAAGALAACESERQRPVGQGVHPDGWGAATSHGAAMREQAYPLDECRGCHGADLAGGDVGIGCSNGAGCHDDGIDDCAGTCHGDESGPLPATGRHATHIGLLECASCHPVPAGLDEGAHINDQVDVVLASWDPGSGRCADGCHDGQSPGWDDGAPLGCDGCHQQSPAHDRFERVVSTDRCGDCHAGSPGAGHIDGVLAIAIDSCAACHGQSGLGAPSPTLDGAADPGAHRRHLDPLLPGRIGKPVACAGCHPVPDTLFEPGHLDDSAPVDVDVVLGDYDPASGTCVAGCHFDRDPGPSWTDSSGAELACDACHEFPPVTTRTGTRHPPSPASLPACLDCHAYEAATHVDGEVTFR